MLILYFILIAGLAAIDQLIKLWAVQVLQPVHDIPLIRFGDTDILRLRYLLNDGAAFGGLSQKRWLLVGITAVLSAVCLIALMKYYRRSKFFSVTISMIVAGGVGNLIDRLFRGGLVVDYVDVICIHFPVFNFADCCIVIGCFLLFIFCWRGFPDERKGKLKKQVKDNA